MLLQQKLECKEPTNKNILFYSNKIRSQPDGEDYTEFIELINS